MVRMASHTCDVGWPLRFVLGSRMKPLCLVSMSRQVQKSRAGY